MGVVFDGTGFGDDTNIWGGEFFSFQKNNIERIAQIEYFDWFLGDKMSRVFLAMLVVILSGCSSIQKYPQFAGGEKVSAPGFDFNLPPGDSWSLVKRNGYPIIFAREGKYPDESYIIGIIILSCQLKNTNSKNKLFKNTIRLLP